MLSYSVMTAFAAEGGGAAGSTLIAVTIDMDEGTTEERLGMKFEVLENDLVITERENLISDYGLYVVSVDAGGPADKAGIKPGDVVWRADGSEVVSPSDLDRVLEHKNPGDAVELSIERGREFSNAQAGVDEGTAEDVERARGELYRTEPPAPASTVQTVSGGDGPGGTSGDVAGVTASEGVDGFAGSDASAQAGESDDSPEASGASGSKDASLPVASTDASRGEGAADASSGSGKSGDASSGSSTAAPSGSTAAPEGKASDGADGSDEAGGMGMVVPVAIGAVLVIAIGAGVAFVRRRNG